MTSRSVQYGGESLGCAADPPWGVCDIGDDVVLLDDAAAALLTPRDLEDPLMERIEVSCGVECAADPLSTLVDEEVVAT